jgi:hypothetical protein
MRTSTSGNESDFSLNTVPTIKKVGSGFSWPLELIPDVGGLDGPLPAGVVGLAGGAGCVCCAEMKIGERRTAVNRTGVNGFILP